MFVFGERLRDDAATLIDTVAERRHRAGADLGRSPRPGARRLQRARHRTRVAHQTPHSKCEWIVGQQSAGHEVAMLGDGINDAPALARADVSIALADGSPPRKDVQI